MRLIIGGAHQGKLAWALQDTGLTNQEVVDGQTCSLSNGTPAAVLDGLHHLVRRALEENLDPVAVCMAYIGPDTVIICDEVGCGVVPLRREERQWREATGRLCCTLAQQADRVDRVLCGLSQRIK